MEKIDMKKLFYESFPNLLELSTVSKPENIGFLQVVMGDFDTDVGDLYFRLSSKQQKCFFSVSQSINSIKYLWQFLESIAQGEKESFWFCDQEGPEVGAYAQYLDDNNIRLILMADGWWNFDKMQVEKVRFDTRKIIFDCICSAKVFVGSMYERMKQIQYPNSPKDFDFWKNEPRDSEIITHFLNGFWPLNITFADRKQP